MPRAMSRASKDEVEDQRVLRYLSMRGGKVTVSMWEILICKLALNNVAPPSLKPAPKERGVILALKDSVCVCISF